MRDIPQIVGAAKKVSMNPGHGAPERRWVINSHIDFNGFGSPATYLHLDAVPGLTH